MEFRRFLSGCVATTMVAFSMINPQVVSAEYARVSVHDPSIVKLDDGEYYIIGSHLSAGRSTDLQNWYTTANSNLGSTNTTFFNDIYTDLAVPESWSNTTDGYDLSGNMWAPDIIYNEKMGKYCMYLSINGENWNSSIVLCTADDIDGPYTYQGTIVYSGFTNNTTNNVNDTDVPKVLGNNPDISRYLTNGSWNAQYGTNAIDPCVFYDEDGNLHMVYGSWFGGIYMLDLDENTGLRDYNVTYSTTANVSDAYMGKKVAGGNFSSGEGAYVEYMKSPDSNKGYYYLFVSYGYFNSNGGYNIRVFRTESLDEPFVDQNGNSAIYSTYTNNIGGTVGERLMSNYQWSCNTKPYKAQGHNSALMDDDGKLYVIYHTKFDDDYGLHEVRVHQLIMNEDGWLTATPYEYSGETLSEVGHSMDAVTGDYEFIFHTLNQSFVNEQSADVEQSKSITLNSDGTVSGDVTGTWSMENGSPYMSITFDGVTYKGAFIVQSDESEEQTLRMTFTATGNNTCVWGSKKSKYDSTIDTVKLINDSSKLVYNDDSAQGYGTSVKVGDTNFLSGISYNITNKFSGLALDLDYGNTSTGTNIQQWSANGMNAQEWKIITENDGYCRIVSMVDESKCIGVAENSSSNGLNIELQEYTGSDTQLWKLIQDGSYYGIVSKCSGDSAGLDVFDWSTEDGGNIDQWEYWGGDCQLWKITPVYPQVDSGSYTVRNVNSGLFVSESSSNAIQSDAQTLTFTRLDDGTYNVSNVGGKFLTVEGNSSEDGANVSFETYTGDSSQAFELVANKDGSYSLLTVSSNGDRCLDVYGISMDDGANLCQWSYWGGDGQKFVIEPVSTSQTIQGDVNSDGVCNTLDLLTLKRYLLGMDVSVTIASGDLSNDGKVDISDLILLKEIIL